MTDSAELTPPLPGGLRAAYGLLDEAIERRIIPGAVALVGAGGAWLPPYVTGLAVDTPERRIPMRADTVFDLASLTKVVATLPAVLRLVQEGAGTLHEPVVSLFPEWEKDEAKSQITLAHLLTHTSGMPAHRPYYHSV